MSSNKNNGNDGGDIHVNQKPRTRIQNNRIYDEEETPNICDSIFIRNLGRKLHVREGDIPLCSEHDKPLCGDRVGKRRCRNSMDESLSNSPNKHSTTTIHECVM